MKQPKIIYEDNHLIAVNKPGGMLTQGDKTSDPSLFDWTKEYIKERYNKPGDVYLGLLHRLDRPVSGVVCFARTSKAASRVSEQFRRKTTDKIYHAIVHGTPRRHSAHLKNWLLISKGRDSRSSKILTNRHDGAKQAELRYRVLQSFSSTSLLEIELLTGLKHQIRAQLAFISNPIVGDFRYATADSTTSIADGHAILLHAYELQLIHPTRQEPLRLLAPYPEYFPRP